MAPPARHSTSGYVAFFSQILICYVIIIASLYCILFKVDVGRELNNMFVCLVSSAVGYLLPNPKISCENHPTHPPSLPREQTTPTLEVRHSLSVTSASNWKFFGSTLPKSQIVFFSQVLICYVVIGVSIGCLAIGKPSDNDYLFTVLTSSTLGYLLPSPKIKEKKNGVPNNPS